MDIAIKKKKAFEIKHYIVLFLVLPAVVLAIHYFRNISRTELNVEKGRLAFDDVKKGNFRVSVRGSGVLVPDNIRLVSAAVEATVIRLAVKAGSIVKKGDLIVELSNPQLVQQLAEARWELEAMEAELQASRVAQEAALLEQESLVLNAKLNFESSLLKYNAETKLIRQSAGAVSELTYQRTRLEADQFKQRWLISQRQLENMLDNLAAQNNARAARLSKTRKIVERIQQQVDELQVKATMDSIVLEMPLEPGQRITMGTNLAKLAQQDSLIAELQVPEIQIRDVSVGQRVIIDTRNGTMEGRVERVDPTVVNGNVQVDVVFVEDLPADARPDLSVDGEITITEIADTLYVDRPLFAQSQSHSAFYKLSEDGQFARRVEVTTGYGSINQIQIIEGLDPGDRIIVSDPSRFEKYREFRIK